MSPKLLPIDMSFVQEALLRLLRTPSPSGRTDQVMQMIGEYLDAIGVPFELTRRGTLIATLAGDVEEGPHRAIVVHADTIGCMVRGIKENGRLRLEPIGTHSARFSEGARVTIFADDVDRTYTGTILPLKASGHAFGAEVDTQPVGWSHVELRIDELIDNAADVGRLGIAIGDYVSLDSVPVLTDTGFVQARHLDDKAGIAAVLGAFKAVVDAGVVLPLKTHLGVTIAEEVGLGASHGLNADVAEMLSVDNAVVAPGQSSRENIVNIAMQDSHGPFDFHLTRRLAAMCRELDIPFERDVFGSYRSDVASALEAGAEMRAALIGFGVDASHGYERTHVDGIRRVGELVAAYMQSGLTFRHWDATPTGTLEEFPSQLQPAEEQGPR